MEKASLDSSQVYGASSIFPDFFSCLFSFPFPHTSTLRSQLRAVGCAAGANQILWW
jgi:hypothetical protein